MKRPSVPSAFVAGLALGWLSVAAAGASAYRVRDLNPDRGNLGSEPHDFVAVGSRVVFTATDSRHGSEMWSTDGTAAGTELLGDFCVGPCAGAPYVFAATPDLLFLGRGRADGRGELLVTDGTRQGLRRLLSVPRGGGGGYPGANLWVPESGRLFFSWSDGKHGQELWSSDGTPGGTKQVIDLRPGRFGSKPQQLVRWQGRVWFIANDGQAGASLYSTDGTAAGTRRLFDPAPGNRYGAKFGALLALDSHLVFEVTRGTGEREFWGSDGTPAGTREVMALDRDLSSKVLAGRLLFPTATPTEGLGLWSSDGTTEGTSRLGSFALFNRYGLYESVVERGFLYFAASRSDLEGFEPWRTDGTAAGTERIADLCPGRCDSLPRFVLAHRGRVYFSTDIRGRGPELWSTAGTEADTRPVADLCDGVCQHRIEVIGTAGPAVVFGSFWGQFGNGLLYRTEGTQETTERISSFPPDGTLPSVYLDALFYAPLGHSGDRLLFSGMDSTDGLEIWSTDGTPEGTRAVVDVSNDNAEGSYPSDGYALGDRLVFQAKSGASRPGIWITDGTAGGTSPLFEYPKIGDLDWYDARPEIFGSAEVNGRLWLGLYAYSSVPYAPEIRITDGTPEGTVALSGTRVAYGPLAALGSRVLFAGLAAEEKRALFASDGTPEGTRELAKLAENELNELVALPVRALFTGPSGSGPSETGRAIWTTDGTPEGTRPLAALGPTRDSWGPPELVRFGDRVWYFQREPGRDADSIGSTDGTAAGTLREVAFDEPGLEVVGLIAAGARLYAFVNTPFQLRLLALEGGTVRVLHVWRSLSGRPMPSQFAAFGDRLFFVPVYAQKPPVWISDGTRSGTKPMRDAHGRPILDPGTLAVEHNGRLWFTAQSRNNEKALWSSDGTPAGTRPETSRIAFPWMIAPAGSRVYFSGRDPEAGVELWAVDR